MRFLSNLNRRRYAQNDDTLYVAPEDARTDYVRAFQIRVNCPRTSLHGFPVSTSNGELVQWRLEVSACVDRGSTRVIDFSWIARVSDGTATPL